jgi:hypothetical protein
VMMTSVLPRWSLRMLEKKFEPPRRQVRQGFFLEGAKLGGAESAEGFRGVWEIGPKLVGITAPASGRIGHRLHRFHRWTIRRIGSGDRFLRFDEELSALSLAFFASWRFDETNPGSKTATSHPPSSIHDLKKVTPPAPAGVPAGRGRVVRGMSKSGAKRRGGQRNEIRWRLGGIDGLESSGEDDGMSQIIKENVVQSVEGHPSHDQSKPRRFSSATTLLYHSRCSLSLPRTRIERSPNPTICSAKVLPVFLLHFISGPMT